MSSFPTYTPYASPSLKFGGSDNYMNIYDYNSYSNNRNICMNDSRYEDICQKKCNENDDIYIKYTQEIEYEKEHSNTVCEDITYKLEQLMAERDSLLSNIKYNTNRKEFEQFCDISNNGSVKIKDSVDTRSLHFNPINNINTEYIIEDTNKNPEKPEFLINASGDTVINNIICINNTLHIDDKERMKFAEYENIMTYRTNNQYKSIDEFIDYLSVNNNTKYYKFTLLIRQLSSDDNLQGIYNKNDIEKLNMIIDKNLSITDDTTQQIDNIKINNFINRIKILEKLANFQYDYKIVDISPDDIINIKTNFFKSIQKCCICNKYINVRYTIYTLDDKYIWDSSLTHYIENHNILYKEIPNDFINYITYMNINFNINDIDNMKIVDLSRGYKNI